MGEQTLKERFVKAINTGELGLIDDYGVYVTRESFTEHFSDIKSQYKTSFLTGAVIEHGRTLASHTRFLFKMGRGLYRVHPDLLEVKPEKEYKLYSQYYMNFGLEKHPER
ncbi:hypothetical protein MNBD_GAMMA10-487 [hydrothermal vent metagenome]|uniref:Uncharacterized protein n=1 Tax=hydrothermal vent metagenome TaxID=652676 RepID=A0A3B0XH75_9ZZZZ